MDLSQLTKASLQAAFVNISVPGIARNLKSKSILLRDFVWRNPAEENLPNQVTESQFTFKAVKESEILKELKNLKRKKRLDRIIFPRDCSKTLLLF